MKVTKKENKELYEALDFCRKAVLKGHVYLSEEPLKHLRVKNGQIVGTDGCRINLTYAEGLDDGVYGFEKKGTAFTLSRKADHYPPIDDFLSTCQFTKKTEVNRDRFRRRCRMMDILRNERYKAVELIFNGRLEMSIKNTDVGEAATEMETSSPIHPEVQTAINAQYLVQAAQSLKGKTIEIHLQKDAHQKPMKLTDSIREIYIMPMRA